MKIWLKHWSNCATRAEKILSYAVSTNSRLDTIQAAILLPKLEILDAEIKSRNILASKYTDSLCGGHNVVCPAILDGNRSAWAQYTLKVSDREKLQHKLKSSGVPTAVHYPLPLNKQPAVCDFDVSFRNCDAISEQVWVCLYTQR